jgi:hypothetical protein
MCAAVKGIEFYADGVTVKRIDFWASSCDATAMAEAITEDITQQEK